MFNSRRDISEVFKVDYWLLQNLSWNSTDLYFFHKFVVLGGKFIVYSLCLLFLVIKWGQKIEVLDSFRKKQMFIQIIKYFALIVPFDKSFTCALRLKISARTAINLLTYLKNVLFVLNLIDNGWLLENMGWHLI